MRRYHLRRIKTTTPEKREKQPTAIKLLEESTTAMNKARIEMPNKITAEIK